MKFQFSQFFSLVPRNRGGGDGVFVEILIQWVWAGLESLHL